MFRVIKITLLLLFVISSLAGNPELSENVSVQKEVLVWVKTIKADDKKVTSKEESSDGAYYLLKNRQIYPEKESEYYYDALRLTSVFFLQSHKVSNLKWYGF